MPIGVINRINNHNQYAIIQDVQHIPPIPPYIDGRCNKLPLLMVIYSLMIPFIVYGSLFFFIEGIIGVNIILSLGFGAIIVGYCMTE